MALGSLSLLLPILETVDDVHSILQTQLSIPVYFSLVNAPFLLHPTLKMLAVTQFVSWKMTEGKHLDLMQ